jgi:hypothetical protein
MTKTPILGLRDLVPNQASKELTINRNMRILESVVQHVVQELRNTVPSGPTEGSVYVVTSPATGIWSGQEGKLALWSNGSWEFINVPIGYIVYSIVNNKEYIKTAFNSWSVFTPNRLLTVSSNPATGIPIVSELSADEMSFLKIQSGNNIYFTDNSGQLVINAKNLTVSSLGTGHAILKTVTSTNSFHDELTARTLKAGNNITLTITANEITIHSKEVRVSSLGTGEALVASVSSNEISSKTLKESANIEIYSNGNEILASAKPSKLNFGASIFNTATSPGIIGVSGAYNNRTLIAEDGITFRIIDSGFAIGDSVGIYFEQNNGNIQAGTGVTLIPGNVVNSNANRFYFIIKKSTGVFLVTGI